VTTIAYIGDEEREKREKKRWEKEIMLNAVMLNVVMQYVVAPGSKIKCYNFLMSIFKGLKGQLFIQNIWPLLSLASQGIY
jgi:hypothetical protein